MWDILLYQVWDIVQAAAGAIVDGHLIASLMVF